MLFESHICLSAQVERVLSDVGLMDSVVRAVGTKQKGEEATEVKGSGFGGPDSYSSLIVPGEAEDSAVPVTLSEKICRMVSDKLRGEDGRTGRGRGGMSRSRGEDGE